MMGSWLQFYCAILYVRSARLVIWGRNWSKCWDRVYKAIVGDYRWEV
jgi:hypothetical protein